MNLSKKLVAVCLLFGAVPMAVIQIINARAMEHLIEDQGRTYEMAARDVGEFIDRNLFERYGDVQAFAVNDTAKKRADWYKPAEQDNAITRVMNNYVALYGIYTITMMVDTEGRVVAANSRDAAGKPVDTSKLYTTNFKDSPWFKAAAAGRFTTQHRFSSEANTKLTGTFVEDVAPDPIAEVVFGQPRRTIGFTAPVRDGDKVIGYWTNRADFAFVEDILRDAQTSMKLPVHVELFNSAGELLGDVEPEGADAEQDDNELGANLAKAGHKVALATSEGKSGSVIWAVEGHGERIHGYAATDGALGYPGLGWGVSVNLGLETAVEDILVAEHQVWGAGIVLLIVVGFASFAFARSIAKPVVHMAEVAAKLADGDVDQEVTHHSKDEVGQLADSFRNMIAYIKGASAAVAQIGSGHTRVEITPRSDKDRLSHGIQSASGQISYLVDQVMGAAFAAEQGNLSARVQVGELKGDYAELASTTNKMLESMIAPVVATTSALERVAACDLTAQVDGDFVGDHARLKNALNTAVSSVRDALLQVARGSEQVKAASSQIASGSQTLASGASEQAASLTETRSVLESVAQMTGRNAENAQHANALSVAARESSARGAGSMEQMTLAVGKIRAAVENTAQIIRDINQIAFQTNLLALNAAVEAARAGDAGRGFAVVADEVRNLAQQAKQAAHKTEELLQDSIRQAERGEAITQDVTKNLGEIVGSVRKVGDIIEEIAAASREQASGIEQVHKASSEMDQVTHQNAASSEELSSTAEELAAQAQELSSMVTRFQLGQEGGARAVQPVADRALRRPRLDGGPSASSVVSAPSAMAGAQLIPFHEDVELRDF